MEKNKFTLQSQKKLYKAHNKLGKVDNNKRGRYIKQWYNGKTYKFYNILCGSKPFDSMEIQVILAVSIQF